VVVGIKFFLVLNSYVFRVAGPGLLKRRLTGATQQQPGLLRKDYRSYERNTAGNWIVDHTDVFRAQRSGTMMAKTNRIADFTCL
jgi:hypothetical protein